MPKRLIIIDGNALIHRSFHALPPTMSTKDGQMTNAVYGFASALIKAIKDLKPEYIVLTLDKKGPTFRHQKYKEYKATRAKQPNELYTQFPITRQIAASFNIPIFALAGFEADDLIGTIAKKADGKVEKIILTGDMDTLQLIDGSTKVCAMSRGVTESVIYDAKKVEEKYGLKVSQLIDYKALRGDPSDNIPGVKGIGEKTAVDLLQKFETLENLYNKVESQKSKVESLVKPRVIKLLKEHKEDAFLSKELGTIKRDVKIDFDLEKAKFGKFDKTKIAELFASLEFNSLLPRLKNIGDKGKGESIDKFSRNQKLFKYALINTEADFKKFLEKLKKEKSFTFDIEATGKKYLLVDILGISFSWEKGAAYYVNLDDEKYRKKEETNNLFNYQEKEKEAKDIHPFLEELKSIFENAKIKKNGHNLKYDIGVLANYGIQTAGIDFDTRVASYLLNPGSRQHDLDALAFARLGHDKINKDDLLGKGKSKIEFGQVALEKIANYSCEDADFTQRLWRVLKSELEKEKLAKLFSNIELPLIPALENMERNGILIDQDFLSKMSKKLTKRLETISKKIYKIAGEAFNIKSTKQLKRVLFEKLDIPTLNIAKTKTGFSTSASELAKLREEHVIIPILEEHRELAKLLSTYIDNLPALINPKTNRLHTSFNQTITATGRLSSQEPNLQNIPIKTELGREIRKAFVAKPGYKLLALDYSQIELRLAAHFSGDKTMIEAFQKGEDIHALTAAAINEVEPGEATPQMRREAKAINFGILYGQGPHGLAQTAKIPYWRAKEFIDQYFNVFKDMRNFIDSAIEKAREDGYAQTIFGRRRNLAEINSSVALVRKAAERMAINTPLQGSAADLIKIAMIRVHEYLKNKADICQMLIQVHDELVFEAKAEEAEKLAKMIKKIMEADALDSKKLKVPIVVDVEAGESWGALSMINVQ